MLSQPSNAKRTIVISACTAFLIGLSGSVFAGHKNHDSHKGRGHDRGAGHGHSNELDPDDYSLSWNQECTAVTITVEEDGEPIRKMSYYDGAGNGPTHIKSTKDAPIISPVDLSTTELQSYISPETGGTIRLKVGNKGKKNKRRGGKGRIELNVPACISENMCPFIEDFESTLNQKIEAGFPYIEVRFFGTPSENLTCDTPDSRIAVLSVNPFNDPVSYINPWATELKGMDDGEWGGGVTFIYDNPEQARACAIYLGCTEQ